MRDRGQGVRLAYLVTHPIHYQMPLLRRVAADPDIALTVFHQAETACPAMALSDSKGVGAFPDGIRHELLPALGRRDVLTNLRPWSVGLWRRLRRGGFDALWVHGYARAPHLAAMVGARLLGLRVLLRDDATPVSRRRGPLKTLAKRMFFALLSGVCDRFLTVGALNGEYYRRNGIADHRMVPVPYSVDDILFRPDAEGGRALRRRLGIPPEAPVALFVGRLEPVKRPGDLLAAFHRLGGPAHLAPPHLVIVGEGSLRPSIEAQAGERVHVLGFRDQHELPAIYAMADLLVLPSESETWGMVVNEAMSCGLAVLAGDRVGAAADLVRDGINGLVFPTGDVGALAAALGRLLADTEALRAMGRASLEIIRGWDAAAGHRGLRQALGLGP